MERGLICSTRLYACCVFCVVLSGCIIRVKIAVNQKFCFYLCVHHFLNAMQQNIAFGQRNRTIIYLYSAGIYPIMWWQEGWCERIFGVFCCWLFLFYYICSVNGPVESRWCFVCLFFFLRLVEFLLLICRARRPIRYCRMCVDCGIDFIYLRNERLLLFISF